jgi:hypothetical protein
VLGENILDGKLYKFSLMILDKLRSKGIAVEHISYHDIDDPESPDRLWIEYTPNDPMCEGKYLDLSPYYNDDDKFFAEVASANNFGGHPTHWDMVLSTHNERDIDELLNSVMGFNLAK